MRVLVRACACACGCGRVYEWTRVRACPRVRVRMCLCVRERVWARVGAHACALETAGSSTCGWRNFFLRLFRAAAVFNCWVMGSG